MTAGPFRAAVVAALVVVGCLFLTVGTVGLLRFPNVYNRMHATSKPTTLGTAAVFLAGAVRFWPDGAALASLLGIVFLFLTVPTGAHMIARSAQRMGIPFEGSVTWPSRPEDRIEDDSETVAPPAAAAAESPAVTALPPAATREFRPERDGATRDREGREPEPDPRPEPESEPDPEGETPPENPDRDDG